MRSKSKHSGFTLVELLVVIAIIGMLVAMLLPAVQAAREAARRSQCGNHLKQLSLAILNYEQAHDALPVSCAYDGPSDLAADETVPNSSKTGKGWIISILPYLEQQALYEAFLPGFVGGGPMIPYRGIQRPECLAAMQTVLPTLHCPSDPDSLKLSSDQRQWNGSENSPVLPVALTNYKGSIGDTRIGGGHTGSADCHRKRRCPGLFWRYTNLAPVRMAHIRDGASNTFMLGEDVPAENNHSAAFYSNGDYASCHAPLNYFPRPSTPTEFRDVMSFRSRHPGGAQFAMADGSVQFVNETIALGLYQALATKAGGEAVSLP